MTKKQENQNKEFFEQGYNQGKENTIKEILRLFQKIKIRETISYPTMLNHHYVSERDFNELKNKIEQGESK
jgi:hypothetical protein